MSKVNIAIDGPAAVGKTTIGQALAEIYNYKYIDSGLFYRYLGYFYSTDNNINDLFGFGMPKT